MKICYYANSKGAHEKKWAEYFVNKGHDISFISLDSLGNMSYSERMHGTHNFDIPIRYINNPIIRVIYRLIFSPIIAYKISKTKKY